jgi:hypothetical protein
MIFEKGFFLQIAGFKLQFISSEALFVDDAHMPFVVDANAYDADIVINCHAGFPNLDFANQKPSFEAANDDLVFYRIYAESNQFKIVIFNQQKNTEIQHVAFLNADLKQWDIYTKRNNDSSISPLTYPMGPVLMHYMTHTAEAVMMHAACVVDGNIGRMFSGFSGAGKSTMSGIWAKAGHTIVNDDRVIIRKENAKFYVYNTPMYYVDMPKRIELQSIYLIYHSPENKIEKLKGAIALSKVMAFSIQNNFDKQFVAQRLALFADLCSNVGVYQLGVVPNQAIIDFVRNNE